jgi:protein O-mannosyl-transferase
MRHWITNRSGLILSALLVGMTIYVYWLTPGFTFVDVDDVTYLMSHPQLWDGVTVENLRWAFTTTFFSNWHPLTWISYILDMEFFGQDDPGSFHLTNVAFHIANVLLLFFLFRRMTGDLWKSAFVAAVFAVHPLRVESVAWVSERKDVLSTFFGLLSLIGYVRYAQQGGRQWFWAAWGAFACSLMAKQTLVTLPFVFLLLDYWPLARFKSSAPIDGINDSPRQTGRKSLKKRTHHAPSPWRGIGKLVLEKWPLFLLTIAGCAAAIIAQKQGSMIASLENLTLSQRLQNVVVVYGLYLLQTIWPSGLCVYYPFPPGGIPVGEVLLWGTVLAAITIVAVRRVRRHPYVLIGWLWYLGTLVPVIGIVHVGVQRMADRYTYVPGIGLAMAAAWLIPAIVPAGTWRRIGVPAAAIAVLLAFMIVARQQTTYWANSIVLYERVIAVNPANAFTHYRFARVLARANQAERAIEQYQITVRLDPDLFEAQHSLGCALTDQGRFDEAINHFEEALRVYPGYAHAHYNLGFVLYQRNRIDEALRHFREAVRLNPYDEMVRNNISMIEEEIREKSKRSGSTSPSPELSRDDAGPRDGDNRH